MLAMLSEKQNPYVEYESVHELSKHPRSIYTIQKANSKAFLPIAKLISGAVGTSRLAIP